MRDFKQDLDKSRVNYDKAIKILNKHFNDKFVVYKCNGNDGGTDLISKKGIRIDVKDRTLSKRQWTAKEIPVEIRMDFGTYEKKGWAVDFTKNTHYLLWICHDWVVLYDFNEFQGIVKNLYPLITAGSPMHSTTRTRYGSYKTYFYPTNIKIFKDSIKNCWKYKDI